MVECKLCERFKLEEKKQKPQLAIYKQRRKPSNNLNYLLFVKQKNEFKKNWKLKGDRGQCCTIKKPMKF